MRVPIAVFRDTSIRALRSIGHTVEDAVLITEVLQFAEIRGNNQGIIKLVTGALAANASAGEIRTVFETPVSAKLDGAHRIGMVVVEKAVDIAIAKAKATGIAVVGCSGYASATGALGMWARRITDHGLIAIVMSQCSEMVAPHGSYEAIFGTNPLAIGIPTKPRAQILDMATSAAAYYGIKSAEAAGQPIPGDIAYNAQGQLTTNPTEALLGAIRVFDRGVKGSHLSLMVELLAGAFTGAAMTDKLHANNWGSFVLAIQPGVLGDEEGFLASAMEMCERVKQAKVLPGGGGPLLLPGERGDQVEADNLALGTLELDDKLFEQLSAMADQCPP